MRKSDIDKSYRILVLEWLILITQLLIWGGDPMMQTALRKRQDELFSETQAAKTVLRQ
jgi:hypothetical protein